MACCGGERAAGGGGSGREDGKSGGVATAVGLSGAYLVVGYDVIAEAAEGLLQGEAFNEDFLMCVATIGALCIGFLPGAETEFPEAVFVMLFFQVGELFEDYAEGNSRKSISTLMNIRPDTANVERNGQVETVAPDQVTIGETIVVRLARKFRLTATLSKAYRASIRWH